MQGLYGVATSSVAEVYGNVSSYLIRYIEEHLDKNFFHYKSISTELSYRNLRRQLGANTQNEKSKRKKPYLIVNPLIKEMSNDMFLYDVPLTKNYDTLETGIDVRHLQTIFEDKENLFSLRYRINHIRLEFNITLTVSNVLQQMNLYNKLLNQFTWDQPIGYVVPLEAQIPKSMVEYIAAIKQCDITKDINIPYFIDYLNSHSRNPITRKIYTGSSLKEFYMYYKHTVLFTFSDMSMEAGNKKGAVDDSYSITFNVSTEFNIPALFALIGEKPEYTNLKVGLSVMEEDNDISNYMPLFTIDNLDCAYRDNSSGYRFYTSLLIEMDKNDDGKDVSLPFLLFKKEDMDILAKVKDMYMDNENIFTLIDLKLLKDGVPLEYGKGKDFYVDWNSLNLYINNVDYIASYRIFMYVNQVKINSDIK